MAAVTSAVLGIVGGVASAAMSFSAAEKEQKLSAEAQKKQDEAIERAKSLAEIDRYSKLALPMDAYEQKQEGSAQDIKTVMEMVSQGDQRNIAALTPGLGAQVTQGRQQTMQDMGQDMFALDKMKADAATRRDDLLIDIESDVAKDQAKRLRDSQERRAQNIESGITGITDTLDSAAELAPLYTKDKGTRKGTKLAKKYSKQKPTGMSDEKWIEELSQQKYWDYLDKDYSGEDAIFLGGSSGFMWED